LRKLISLLSPSGFVGSEPLSPSKITQQSSIQETQPQTQRPAEISNWVQLLLLFLGETIGINTQFNHIAWPITLFRMWSFLKSDRINANKIKTLVYYKPRP